MTSELRELQKEVCNEFNADVCEVFLGDKVGISQSAMDGVLPLNGLRHPYTSGTTGWYLWGGEELSDAADFFRPLHVGHLQEFCKLSLKYLLLPPGWRFLTNGSYEDIWFDPSPLNVDGD
ncbi:hypothetical protein [Ruegeria sp. EL01]|uniref:immunity protein Imm33 domain-containing protein n=1 Tax=Ruegeria sp. EL01 TaxID=2107578 RepID=UPI000EA80B9C|nr:hypothetical protein [Ruegeria sp. EL01]